MGDEEVGDIGVDAEGRRPSRDDLTMRGKALMWQIAEQGVSATPVTIPVRVGSLAVQSA
jgi:hypothetical protein